MRDIKFKFWLGHIGKMTYEHSLATIGEVIKEFTPDIIPLQFTGLTDKNGKEIYEWDIIDTFSGKYEVSFENGCFSVIDEGKHYLLTVCPQEQIEVIGNIYESPNLLNP